MKYFPFYFDLSRMKVLVVGGGNIALAKVKLLLKAKAEITLVSPVILPEIAELLESDGGGGKLILRGFNEADADGFGLVISATESESVNKRVHDAAKAREIPINVVDQQELCDFIFPSIVDRSPLVVSISSEGTAPVLATYWRNKLETIIPKVTGDFAQLLGDWRVRIKSKFKDITERRKFYRKLIESVPISVDGLSGSKKSMEAHAEKLIRDALNSKAGEESGEMESGKVFLIGAGPGDPELLTIKAVNLLSQADIVFYDRLVSPEILDYCRREASLVSVGKRCGHHPIPQSKINDLLLKAAREGKTVIRLKGGDPFVYGRGGEEAEHLIRHGIEVSFVPGITAALGAAASVGVPLTLRNVANSLGIHTFYDSDQMSIIDNLNPDARQTLVFYMSGRRLSGLCDKLCGNGFDANTPFTVIENATLANQEVFNGVISFPELITKKMNHEYPSVIIIGEVTTHALSAR